ncbi:hypothetical protein BCV70DRAFT_78795 [Testicularia cyperi]|uniref:Uncharacterized protein n=1 Tax=Testicularia cyperi TaxID=1882483 RepID=A0A317XUY1_9BASI|nr:hypothetical protein BCV70DRAFT_78795 [Testicularia cyperi]
MQSPQGPQGSFGSPSSSTSPPSPFGRFGFKRKSLHNSHAQTSPSSLYAASTPSTHRIVHAEGNEFVLEPLPARPPVSQATSRRASHTATFHAWRSSVTSSTAGSDSQRRSVSGAVASSSSLPSSVSAAQTSKSSSPTALVSPAASTSGFRASALEKPYRPPPSSTARYFGRQDHIWAAPTLPTVSAPSDGSVDSSNMAVCPAPVKTDQTRTPSPFIVQISPRSSSRTAHTDRIARSPKVGRDRSGSNVSILSRFRASSVSSLGPNELGEDDGSMSVAGSFTRSRVSGMQDFDGSDDESDFDNMLSHVGARGGHSPSQSPLKSVVESRPSLAQPVDELPTRLRSRRSSASMTSPVNRPSFDVSLQSHDDWDEELGIADLRPSAPLHLPAFQELPPTPTTTNKTRLLSGSSSGPMPFVNHAERAFATDTPLPSPSRLQTIRTADLRGIRVTSSVSESWDDDFLFQNEEVDAGQGPDATCGRSRGKHDPAQDIPRAPPASIQGSVLNLSDDDEDMENWDDSYAWIGDSKSTGAHRWSVEQSELDESLVHADRDDRDSSTNRMPVGLHNVQAEEARDSCKRYSASSNISDSTEISARLAAQSDISSCCTRSSMDISDGHQGSPSRSLPVSREGLGVREDSTASHYGSSLRLDGAAGGESSGDETETESGAALAPESIRILPTRRSLGQALGFASRRSLDRRNVNEDATQLPRPASGPSSSVHQEDARSKTKTKNSSIYRFSFSRSRNNVTTAASASKTSLTTIEDTAQSPTKAGYQPTNTARLSDAAQVHTPQNASQSGKTGAEASVAAATPTRTSSSSYRVLRSDRSSSKTLRGDLQQHTNVQPRSPPSSWAGQPPLQHPAAIAGQGAADMLVESKQNRPTHASRSLSGSGDANDDPRADSRGSKRVGSAPMYGSRSVSASTATSYGSSETGFRLHRKDSSMSGFETNDSETTYGTSVGSSPAGGYFPAAFAMQSVRKPSVLPVSVYDTDTSEPMSRTGRSKDRFEHDATSVRATSMPGSPLSQRAVLADGSSTHFSAGPDASPATLHQQNSSEHSGTSSNNGSSHNERARNHGLSESTFDADLPSRPQQLLSHPDAAASATIASIVASAELNAPPVSHQALNADKVSQIRPYTRRNSLSDLKIPSRISKAQTGIKNNMNLVRDFAKGIEELKNLKVHYMRAKLDSLDTGYSEDEKVKNWLECAEVLIGLGEGRSESDAVAHVDTLSHTPMSQQRGTPLGGHQSGLVNSVEADSPTSAAAASAATHDPLTPLNHRTLSDVSHTSFHPAEAVRSVDAQREIDILSAILGSARIAAPAASAITTSSAGKTKSMSRRQRAPELSPNDRTRSRGTVSVPTGTPIASSASPAHSLNFSEVSSRPSQRIMHAPAPTVTTPAHHPYRLGATASTESSTSLGGPISVDNLDSADGSRSAKRRLRSASRAGLQGLKELIKAFRGNANDEDTDLLKASAKSPPPSSTSSCVLSRKSIDVSRAPIDEGEAIPSSTTPVQSKRRSLNLRRRSFLRAKGTPAGENVAADAVDGRAASKEPPQPLPMPSSPERRRSGILTRMKEANLSPSKKSIELSLHRVPSSSPSDRTIDAPPRNLPSSLDHIQSARQAALGALHGSSVKHSSALKKDSLKQRAESRYASISKGPASRPVVSRNESQRISAAPTLISQAASQGPSSQMTPTKRTVRLSSNFGSPQSIDVSHPSAAGSEDVESHRGSLSVDSIRRSQDVGRPRQPLRSRSSLEQTVSKPAMVQKLALRPEAMPGLLVYVQATKQHLQAAIDAMDADKGG